MSDGATYGRRLVYNAFTHVTPSHLTHGQWRRPEAASQLAFNELDPWVELARTAERGKLDSIFFGDTAGVYDKYKGGWATVAREGMQFPGNDPLSIISALGLVTEHLGFAVTSNVLEHPFSFARRASTLDHVTRGRFAWNIVTGYLDNAARNYGFDALEAHDERYAWGDEYVDVVYKLWEGSWEDGAVLADAARGIYADPERIHEINHVSERYRVQGPHLLQPSPQRTPVLFQAGASEAGRDFAARNAEVTFLPAQTPEAAAKDISDLGRRLRAVGRHEDDLLFFVTLHPIIGSTEEEAVRKLAEFDEWISDEGYLAHMSGGMGIDLGDVDPDRPLKDFQTEYVRGTLRALIDAAPDKEVTFGDAIRRRYHRPTAGTPEQVADEVERWAAAGIDGFNLVPVTTPGWFAEFVDQVVPVLRERDLIQSEYRPGTLREKLFAGRGGDRGPHLPDRHPARARRPWAARSPA